MHGLFTHEQNRLFLHAYPPIFIMEVAKMENLEKKCESCSLKEDKLLNKYGYHVECEKYKPVSDNNRKCLYEAIKRH
jgi:hypothetical protein